VACHIRTAPWLVVSLSCTGSVCRSLVRKWKPARSSACIATARSDLGRRRGIRRRIRRWLRRGSSCGLRRGSRRWSSCGLAIAIAPLIGTVCVAPWLVVTLSCTRSICHSVVREGKHARSSTCIATARSVLAVAIAPLVACHIRTAPWLVVSLSCTGSVCRSLVRKWKPARSSACIATARSDLGRRRGIRRRIRRWLRRGSSCGLRRGSRRWSSCGLAIAIAPLIGTVCVAPWLVVTLSCTRSICHSVVREGKHASSSACIATARSDLGVSRYGGRRWGHFVTTQAAVTLVTLANTIVQFDTELVFPFDSTRITMAATVGITTATFSAGGVALIRWCTLLAVVPLETKIA